MDVKSITKKWRKGPKKFSNKLIDEVYSLEDQSISFINSSGYFDKVLWPYFNCQASHKHLELIAKYAVFDALIENPVVAQGNLNLILNDKRLNEYLDLVLCLLQSSMGFTIGETKRSSPVDINVTPFFQLLSLLVAKYVSHSAVKPIVRQLFHISIWSNFSNVDSILNKCPSYIKERFANSVKKSTEGCENVYIWDEKHSWIFSMLKSPLDYEDVNNQIKIDSFVRFLVICLQNASIRSHLNIIIKELGFLSIVPTKYECHDLLKFYVYYPIDDFTGEPFSDYETKKANRFFELQKCLNDDQFSLIPSIYDCSNLELERYLDSVGTKKIRETFCDIDINDKRLIREISDSIFNFNYDPNDFIQINFDIDSFHLKDIHKIRGSYLSMAHFLQSEMSHYRDVYHNIVVEHVFQVLDRFLQKRKSKYLFPIKLQKDNKFQVHIANELLKLRTKDNDEAHLWSIGDEVLLLNILPPDRYSKNLVIRKYGVYSITKSSVEYIDLKSKTVKLSDDISRFNYMIKVPKNEYNLKSIVESELKLPYYLQDLFLEFDRPTSGSYFEQKNRPLNLQLNVYGASALVEDCYKLHKSIEPKKSKLQVDQLGVSDSIIVNFDDKTYNKVLDNNNKRIWNLQGGIEGLISSLSTGLTLIETDPFSEWQPCIIEHLLENFPNERILIVSSDPPIFDMNNAITIEKDFEKKLSLLNNQIDSILKEISKILDYTNISQVYSESIEYAETLLHAHIIPMWESFLQKVKKNPSNKTLEEYPFKRMVFSTEDFTMNLKQVAQSYIELKNMFISLNNLQPLIKFKNNHKEIGKYLVNKYSSVVSVSEKYINDNFDTQLNFDTIIISDSHLLDFFTSLQPFYYAHPQRTIIMGNRLLNQNSLFSKFARFSVPVYGNLIDNIPLFEASSQNSWYNSGFDRIMQNIIVNQEQASSSHNLKEAEYLVSVYQYMRCIGYPRELISIGVAGSVQQALLIEMFNKKCGDDLYGLPQIVSHSKIHSVKNDYILLSTHGVSDEEVESVVSRVAFYSRLGLYTFGKFTEKSASRLKIRVGEKYGGSRSKQAFTIENEQHMKDYVSQMEKNIEFKINTN